MDTASLSRIARVGLVAGAATIAACGSDPAPSPEGSPTTIDAGSVTTVEINGTDPDSLTTMPLTEADDGASAVTAVAPSTAETIPESTTEITAQVSTTAAQNEPEPPVPAGEDESDSFDADRLDWMNQFLAGTEDLGAIAEIVGTPSETGLSESLWATATSSVTAAVSAGLTVDGDWEAFPELYGIAPEPWQELNIVSSGALRGPTGDVVGLVVWSGVNPDGEAVARQWVFVAMTADGTRPSSP